MPSSVGCKRHPQTFPPPMSPGAIGTQSPAYHNKAQQKEDRDVQTTMSPTDLSSRAWHRLAIDTHLNLMQHGWRILPRDLPDEWSTYCESRHNMRIYGGQMGEKEKWSSLSIMN